MHSPARDNNYNLVRLFGAILVIYGHSYPLTGNGVPGFAANAVSTIGVKIFFSISGYLVAKSWLADPHLARFFARRALRIFPALVAVVAFSILVLGPLATELTFYHYFKSKVIVLYLKNIFLYISYGLPGVFHKNIYPDAVNGSLWTLPVEFFMYTTTPLILLTFPIIHRYAVFFIVIFATAVSLWSSLPENVADHAVNRWIFYASDVWAGLTLAPYFVVGMAFASTGFDRFFNIYAGFALLFVLGIFDTGAPVKEAMLIAILPYACLSFAKGPNLVARIGGLDISYGLFLYGFPIQQFISHFWAAPLNPWVMFLVSLVVTAIPAWLSWNLVEKPVLAWKPLRPAQQGAKNPVAN